MNTSFKSFAVRILQLLPRPVQHMIGLLRYLQTRTAGGPPKTFKYWLLKRFLADADYVYESGTFLGDSTAVLAQKNRPVETVEPSSALSERARQRLCGSGHKKVIVGRSEDVIGSTIRQIRDNGYRQMTLSASSTRSVYAMLAHRPSRLPKYPPSRLSTQAAADVGERKVVSVYLREAQS